MQQVGALRELPAGLALDGPHVVDPTIEGPPLLQEPEPAAQLRLGLLPGLEARPPVHGLGLRPPLLDLARQPFQALPRRTEITLGFVALAEPPGEPVQALAEHLRGGRFGAGRWGSVRPLARRLTRGSRLHAGGFPAGRFRGERPRTGGLDLLLSDPGSRDPGDPGPRRLSMRGEERSDAGPQGGGLALQRGGPRPALAEGGVGPVVVGGEAQPAIERSVERLGVEVHPAREVAEPPAFALDGRAKVLPPALRLLAAAEVVPPPALRSEPAVERAETILDLLPLPGVRRLEAEPAVALLRLRTLAGAGA